MENKVSRSNKAMVQEKHSLQAPHVAAVDGSRDAFSDDAKLLSIFPDFSSSLKERGVYEEPNSPTSAQVGLFSHMDINTFDSSSLSPRGSHSSVASEMTDIIRVYTRPRPPRSVRGCLSGENTQYYTDVIVAMSPPSSPDYL